MTEIHVISSLSQPVNLDMDYMLDYELVSNRLTVTTELPENLKFALERPPKGAFASVQVVVAKTVTIPGRCIYTVTKRNCTTPSVNYVFTPLIVTCSRVQALNDRIPVKIMTSQMTAKMNGVMFISHSENQICICKRKKLVLAQVLVFGDKRHETKKVVNLADMICTIAFTQHQIGS